MAPGSQPSRSLADQTVQRVLRLADQARGPTHLGTILHKAVQSGSQGAFRVMSPGDQDRYDRAADRQRDQARQNAVKSRRGASNVPAVFAGCALGDTSDLVEVPAAYSSLCAWLIRLVKSPSTVALLGQWRTGKTELGCGLVNAFCGKDRSARYTKALHVFAELASTRSPAAKETIADLIRRYRGYDLLVIDELQANTESNLDRVLFRDIIDERHNNLRATLLIGNLAKQEFDEFVGDAVTKRMNERRGGFYQIPWGPLKFRERPMRDDGKAGA